MVTKKEIMRLCKRFRVKSFSGGQFGEGFITGLQAAETYLEKKEIGSSNQKIGNFTGQQKLERWSQ